MEGVRRVVYLGAGMLNSDSLSMLVIAGIGLACGVLGVLTPGDKPSQDKGVTRAAVTPATA